MLKLISIAASAMLLTVAITAYSQDTGSDKPAAEFLKGSIICVTSVAHNDQGAYGLYIQDPEVRKLGETWFLKGTVPDMPQVPNVGQVVWISLASEAIIQEYKDIDELKKLITQDVGQK